MAHTLQNPELPESFQQSMFIRQVKDRGGGVGGGCRRLGDQLVYTSLIG